MPSLLLAMLCQAAPTWQVRYAQIRDQTPEWDAAGYTPAFGVDWRDREALDVVIADAEDGRHRGIMFFGRALRRAEPLAALRVGITYRTQCSLNEPGLRRSGEVHAFVMTPEAWAALAAEPTAARPSDPGRLPGVLAWGTLHPNGEDITEDRVAAPIELDLPAEAGPELIVGVAWAAYHFSATEGAALSRPVIEPVTPADRRWAFWRALDLDRPELATVRAAVEVGDEPAAIAALARHLREAPRPRPAVPVPAATDAELTRARETLEHVYRLVGAEPYRFDGPIVWNADPYRYDQWAIALNRHFEWVGLAAAYQATGHGAFAREWAEQVRSWVAAMPVDIGLPWIQGPFNRPGRSPLSLDAGIRMGQTWFRAFDTFRAAPEVSDDALVDFARSAWQHGVYLMRPQNFKSGSNWGAMESNGLFHLGVLLPECRDAPLWRETAVARLRGEVSAQVYADGTQMELAPGYHGVTLGNFLGSLELARANGVPLPAEFEASLERMFDALARASLPNRTYPPLNDSSAGGIASWLRRGVALFPGRDDWRWLASDGAEGTAPTETSLVFPQAGWVVFRSGWDRQSAWLLFDAGPFGAGHQHEDKLSVMLHAGGRGLLADGGNYAYDDSPERAYILSTRSHSTVRIDGRDQATKLDRSQYVVREADDRGFRFEPPFAYARGVHTAGYAAPVGRSVVHRRRVLYVEPATWIIVDDLAAADDAEHLATAQFLLEATAAEVDPVTGAVTSVTAPDQPRLAITPLVGRPEVRVVAGQREPELLGWVSAAHRELRAVPAVLFETRFRGAATVAWRLDVVGADSAPSPVAVTVDGTTLRATLGERTFAAAEPALGVPATE